MSEGERTRRFLLCGEVDGGERHYLLRPGLNRIGRLAGNHVVLAVDGVSKRHAAVIVGREGIRLQDLASKNGSFINGRRALDEALERGDEVRFGPVRLELRTAEPGRGALAIEISNDGSPAIDGETTLTAAASSAAGADGWRTALSFPDGYVICESPSMRDLYRQVAAVARSELPVLVLGDSGVGKEAIARTLHASSRRGGPFAAVNCSAIPRELLEAELFGIAAGAATGVAGRPGVFRAAAGGTVLLDEIGSMPLALQSKLLRALEDGEIQPVGAPPEPIDVRVTAATNAKLAERLEAGRFRRDLYYRLAGCVLRVPPLGERPEDLPLLIERFLERSARRAGRGIRGLTAGALRWLCERPWPGNVRQLEHEIQRLVLLAAESETLTEQTVAVAVEAVERRPAAVDRAGGDGGPARDSGSDLDLAALERKAIAEALRRTAGNQARAARLLGISRFALRRRLERHGLAGGDSSR